MIKKLGLSLLTFSVLTTGLFAKADESLVAQYMDISGAKITIESIGEQITASMQQSSMMYGESVDEKKMQFLQEAFNGDEGLDIVSAYLSENFDNKNIKEIIAYYQTPLGKKVTQASIDAMNPDVQAQMLHFMADLPSNPPSAERTSTIKIFVSELGLVESLEDMYVEMLLFLNEEASQNKKLSTQDMEQFMAMMGQAFEQQMFISSLYIYRDIDNKELKNVISFYNTVAGENELKIVRAAMVKMLKSGFSRAMSK